MNIYDQIYMYKTIFTNKIAIKSKEISISYDNLLNTANQISNGLLYLEKQYSKTGVAVILENCVEFIQIFLGAAAAHIPLYIIDPKRSSFEINAILEDCKPVVAFVDHNTINKVDKCLVSCIISIDDRSNLYLEKWRKEYECNSVCNKRHDKNGNVLFLGFTSGTTGNPKGYIRTHESWFESFYLTANTFNINCKNIVLAPGPLAYSFSIYAAIHTLFVGGTFYFVEKYNPKQIVEIMSQEENVVCYLVPTMIKSFMDFVIQNNVRDITSLESVITSSAKCSPALKRILKERFPNANIVEYYGTSEASFISMLKLEDPIEKSNSVGRIFNNVEIMLKDGERIIEAANTIGKLYVRSNMLFKGYLIDGKEVKKSITDDGWFETGDYVRVDDDNYLYICGRANNMLISGGINVFPEEVESVLLLLDEIEDVIVTGVEDSYWGEKIIALIKWKGPKMEPQDIKEYCKNHLPPYKIPQEFYNVEQFPHTISGKIIREEAMKLISL